jgi:hypothetical protein
MTSALGGGVEAKVDGCGQGGGSIKSEILRTS